jgi:hypothetical protein
MTDKTTDKPAASADTTQSDTPKTDAALDAALAMIPPVDTPAAPAAARVNEAEKAVPQDHPPGDAKSVFYKTPGGWAKFNRDGDGWMTDAQDFSRYPDDYFDFVGVPVVKSLD